MEARRSVRAAVPELLLAAGVGLRVFAVIWFPVAADASEYAVLGTSILAGRGMWLPYGEWWETETWLSGPSHHFPPVYPIYLAPFLAAFGYTTRTVQLAALVAGLALLLVFRRTTAWLFGREPARWFAALLALDPVLIATTGTGYAENLVTLLFVVTVAGILKSLDRPRWILVAGLTAGLAYLTKSSVGPFFLIAGVAGFAWRFRFVRWAVFRDRAYLGAIGIFAAIAGTWAARNLAVFWDRTPAGLLTAWQRARCSRVNGGSPSAIPRTTSGFRRCDCRSSPRCSSSLPDPGGGSSGRSGRSRCSQRRGPARWRSQWG